MVQEICATRQYLCFSFTWVRILPFLYEYYWKWKICVLYKSKPIISSSSTSLNISFVFNVINRFCYQNGIGVERNEKEAVYWYTLSAKKNHAPAQLSLGFCLRNGVGIEKNEREAVRWFTLAAEQGNALAQNSLGFCFEESIGMDEANPKQAVYWYQRSANQNNPWAQCNLGYCK